MSENIKNSETPAIVLPEPGSLLISSSPHIRGRDSVAQVMLLVVLCLLPACFAGIWFFGFPALKVMLLCTCFCIFFEYLWCEVAKQPQTITNMSAALTGLILALNLSANAPWWLCMVGSFIAIVIAKQVFGGIGQNPFNPAAVARVALLVGFTKPMTDWVAPTAGKIFGLGTGVDATTCATPLALAKASVGSAEKMAQFTTPEFLWPCFTGNIGGCIGETSALALIIGGVALLLLRVVKCHIPIAILVTVFVFTFIANKFDPSLTPGPMFHLLTGGVLIGAFFMATDMVTSPVTSIGAIIFGVGIGVIACIVRIWGGFPEGMSFAIVIMNAFVPLIDKMCYKRPFGWQPGMGRAVLQPRRGEIK